MCGQHWEENLESAVNVVGDSAPICIFCVRMELNISAWADSGLAFQPWCMQSSWITGTLGNCPPALGCTSLPWNSRGNFYSPHSSSAAELLYFLSKWGISKLPYIDSPSKQKLLCRAEKRLCSQKPVCSSRGNLSQKGYCIFLEIEHCLHPQNVTAAAACHQSLPTCRMLKRSTVLRVCALQYMHVHVWVSVISQSKYARLVVVGFHLGFFGFSFYNH